MEEAASTTGTGSCNIALGPQVEQLFSAPHLYLYCVSAVEGPFDAINLVDLPLVVLYGTWWAIGEQFLLVIFNHRQMGP